VPPLVNSSSAAKRSVPFDARAGYTNAWPGLSKPYLACKVALTGAKNIMACKFYDFMIFACTICAKKSSVRIKTRGESRYMSEKHPECPLYNPLNCKEYYNPKLCAFVRKDRACLKKKKPKQKQKTDDEE
jgi:hypothetical protein